MDIHRDVSYAAWMDEQRAKALKDQRDNGQ